jgi:hypothetical protein
LASGRATTTYRARTAAYFGVPATYKGVPATYRGVPATYKDVLCASTIGADSEGMGLEIGFER